MNKMIPMVMVIMTGCSLFPVKTEYIKVSYPVLVCPDPPELKAPELYINKLTLDDSVDFGKVAKYYDITLKQLTDYIDDLELVIDRYSKTSKSYRELESNLDLLMIEPPKGN